MNIITKYNGVREYEEEDVITFPNGLPGLNNLKKFILFSVEENGIFNMLHSIEDMEIGLVVVSPFNVMKEYEFNLDDIKVGQLNIKDKSDIIVLTTVCLNKDVKMITTNLKAPIVINIREKIGEQLILDDDKYLIKYPLFKGE